MVLSGSAQLQPSSPPPSSPTIHHRAVQDWVARGEPSAWSALRSACAVTTVGVVTGTAVVQAALGVFTVGVGIFLAATDDGIRWDCEPVLL